MTHDEPKADINIFSLDQPVALDIGSHFVVREGGKTVGSGVIVEVVE